MNKDKLLKIYSAYLPYKLKINDPKSPIERELTHKGYWHRSSEDDTVYVGVDEAIDYNLKPILYDLSSLTKEIEHEGEKFVPIKKLKKYGFYRVENDEYILRREGSFGSWSGYYNCEALPYYIIQMLLEWHFNVFSILEDQFINKATLTNK